jgi:ubiquitin-protein ligase
MRGCIIRYFPRLGATVQVFEDRMDLLRCFVEGPTGTPYEGGLFILDLRLPAQVRKPPSLPRIWATFSFL